MATLQDDLARILTPDYLSDVGSLSLADIRRMRSECQEAETALSYLRRLVQGRLDIVHAYLDSASESGAPDLSSVVDALPEILAGGGGRTVGGPGRNPVLHSPDTESLEEVTEELDAILGADNLSRLAHLDQSDLADLADQLRVLENRVSGERRGLHERIDTLQAELVARHKSGQASVDGLLS
jgi:hypothetical protein